MVRRLIGGGHQLRGPPDLMGDRTMELRIFTDADAVAAEAARLIAAERVCQGQALVPADRSATGEKA